MKEKYICDLYRKGIEGNHIFHKGKYFHMACYSIVMLHKDKEYEKRCKYGKSMPDEQQAKLF
jgi:hypothetical protein